MPNSPWGNESSTNNLFVLFKDAAPLVNPMGTRATRSEVQSLHVALRPFGNVNHEVPFARMRFSIASAYTCAPRQIPDLSLPCSHMDTTHSHAFRFKSKTCPVAKIPAVLFRIQSERCVKHQRVTALHPCWRSFNRGGKCAGVRTIPVAIVKVAEESFSRPSFHFFVLRGGSRIDRAALSLAFVRSTVNVRAHQPPRTELVQTICGLFEFSPSSGFSLMITRVSCC